LFLPEILASDSIGWRHSLGFDVRPSYPCSSYRADILKSILDMEDARKTNIATSLHLQYGFSFPSGSRQGRICPDAWQGLGVAVNFMGNPKGLGTPVSLYAFQGAPVYRFSRRLSLYYEWNFGASFGWRPCDGRIARSNLIVGSSVNAYINLGAGLMCRLNDAYSLMAGLDLTHYSNGNTSFPNPGVNMAGLRIGVVRTLSCSSTDMGYGREVSNLPVASFMEGRLLNSPKKNRRPEFDLTVYGSLRKRVYRGGEDPVLLRGRYAVAGLDFAPMWRVTRNFRTGPSLDIQWDESTDLKRNHVSGTTSDDIRFYRPSFFRQVCIGMSGRAELVMPLFSVNVGIGYNIIGPEETRATYQLANLKVRLTDRFFLNIGYQLLDFRKQNNLMLGLGYTFN
ncbi:MAG: acyloxyacyl hydrolase, partial [Muribaculaceae bacterium]|nr:acyloxyacyl hydrolase [Muribaculaceae bacterium]